MCVLFIFIEEKIFKSQFGHCEMQYLPCIGERRKLTVNVFFMHFLANFHLNETRVKSGSLYLA